MRSSSRSLVALLFISLTVVIALLIIGCSVTYAKHTHTHYGSKPTILEVQETERQTKNVTLSEAKTLMELAKEQAKKLGDDG